MQDRPVTPALTVDVIIESSTEAGAVVLIERRHPPPGWALPGGFVDVGETVEQAAVREAHEETGLKVVLQGVLGVYSDPCRDTRRHTASVVFVALADGEPRGGDDARTAHWVAVNQLPTLAFDHARILADFMDWRAGHRSLAPLIHGASN